MTSERFRFHWWTVWAWLLLGLAMATCVVIVFTGTAQSFTTVDDLQSGAYAEVLTTNPKAGETTTCKVAPHGYLGYTTECTTSVDKPYGQCEPGMTFLCQTRYGYRSCGCVPE